MNFSPNLNILTGETGAGKSILIDAITLLFKKNVPEGTIRGENNKLVVEAMFTRGDEEFALRREVEGSKSLCFLNGRMVPFAQLKEMAEGLLNIYGQNEHTFLLNPANHRLFLDKFSQNQDLLARISAVYEALKTHIKELQELEQQEKTAKEKLDFISFQISEIESLKLARGDDVVLEQRVRILNSAEEIISKSNSVIQDFYQGDGSVYNIIADHLKNLEYLKGIYPQLACLTDEVDRFYNLLPEISETLSSLTGKIEYDEDELNALEDKLLKLNRLKSKYQLTLDELLDKLEELKKETGVLANMEFSVKEKKQEIDRLFAVYKEQNNELRARRKEKAKELRAIIEGELEKLEMKNARFLVEFDEIEPDIHSISDRGSDKVEFYFSSNPGQKPGQIKNVASGGELSRLMLVLKSMSRDKDYSAYIFDEIDVGIGGKTAEFVGEKLKRIAETNQVICISHLPQIASFADRHFLITKEFEHDQTFSYVRELAGEDKVMEIGRLMVGSRVNEDVLKAAANLLAKNSRL